MGKVACIIPGMPSGMQAIPVDGGGSPLRVSSAFWACSARH